MDYEIILKNDDSRSLSTNIFTLYTAQNNSISMPFQINENFFAQLEKFFVHYPLLNSYIDI